MTDDKKKLESCFDNLEKIVSLHNTLSSAASSISVFLGCAIDRLGENGETDLPEVGAVEIKEGLIQLDDTDVEFINRMYTDSLWNTMQLLLPHYKTDK